MTSTLKQFKARALARPKVKKAYDDLAEEFAFLDEVLKARAQSGLLLTHSLPISGGSYDAGLPRIAHSRGDCRIADRP